MAHSDISKVMSKDVSGSQSSAISVDEIFGSIWLTTSFAGLIHRYTMAIIQQGEQQRMSQPAQLVEFLQRDLAVPPEAIAQPPTDGVVAVRYLNHSPARSDFRLA